MLQSMGSQRAGHDLVAEQQQTLYGVLFFNPSFIEMDNRYRYCLRLNLRERKISSITKFSQHSYHPGSVHHCSSKTCSSETFLRKPAKRCLSFIALWNKCQQHSMS